MRGKKASGVARPSLPWQALQGRMRWAMVSGTGGGEPATAAGTAARTSATAASGRRRMDAIMSCDCAPDRVRRTVSLTAMRPRSRPRPREATLVAQQHLRVALLEELLRHRALVAAEAVLDGVAAGAVEGLEVLHHHLREHAILPPLAVPRVRGLQQHLAPDAVGVGVDQVGVGERGPLA